MDFGKTDNQEICLLFNMENREGTKTWWNSSLTQMPPERKGGETPEILRVACTKTDT